MALSLGLSLGLASLSQGGEAFDFRTAMPAGSTYTRTGAASGVSLAGLVESFAADAPQRTTRGLALEPARTNLLIRSAEFDNATWTKVLCTTTANATTAPDGTLTADKMIPNAAAANGAAATYQTITKAAVATTYTVTLFAKFAGHPFVSILCRDSASSANNASVTFNAETGAITTAAAAAGTFSAASSPAAIALADGWFLFRLTFTSGTEVNFRVNAIPRDIVGDGVSGVFLWGAQLEAASDGSSYIPTTTATATRGLSVFTETVPAGRTKALLTYADATTTLVTGLTPGGTFDVATAVIGAGKGRSSASELVTRVWQA